MRLFKEADVPSRRLPFLPKKVTLMEYACHYRKVNDINSESGERMKAKASELKEVEYRSRSRLDGRKTPVLSAEQWAPIWDSEFTEEI